MKDPLLHGEKVSLKPATPEEIPQFFAGATNPDPEVQRYFYGDEIPTYEEFLSFSTCTGKTCSSELAQRGEVEKNFSNRGLRCEVCLSGEKG